MGIMKTYLNTWLLCTLLLVACGDNPNHLQLEDHLLKVGTRCPILPNLMTEISGSGHAVAQDEKTAVEIATITAENALGAKLADKANMKTMADIYCREHSAGQCVAGTYSMTHLAPRETDRQSGPSADAETTDDDGAWQWMCKYQEDQPADCDDPKFRSENPGYAFIELSSTVIFTVTCRAE